MTYLRDMPPVPYGEEYPLFKRVSIETTSWCNRACGFCPHGRRKRPKERMSPGLWTKIVTELRDLDFRGVVQLHLLNEPLLDPLLLTELRELRAACPRARLMFATNGDYVESTETIDDLVAAGLNGLIWSAYDDESYAKGRTIADCYDELDHPYNPPLRQYGEPYFGMKVVDMRAGREPPPLTARLCNRGQDDRPSKAAYCARPMRHLVIRVDGKVPICCAVDPLDEALPLMGDVTTQTMKQVWNGVKLFAYRFRLQNRERVLPGCDHCDHQMAYPHLVRLVKEAPAGPGERSQGT